MKVNIDTLKKFILEAFSEEAQDRQLHRVIMAPTSLHLNNTYIELDLTNTGEPVQAFSSATAHEAIRQLTQDGKLALGNVETIENTSYQGMRTQRLTSNLDKTVKPK